MFLVKSECLPDGPDKLVIRQLRYRDDGLWRIVAEGYKEGTAPITILAGGGGQARAAVQGTLTSVAAAGGEGRLLLSDLFESGPRVAQVGQKRKGDSVPRGNAEREDPSGDGEVQLAEADVIAGLCAELGLSEGFFAPEEMTDVKDVLAEVCTPEEATSLERCFAELEHFHEEAEEEEERAEARAARPRGPRPRTVHATAGPASASFAGEASPAVGVVHGVAASPAVGVVHAVAASPAVGPPRAVAGARVVEVGCGNFQDAAGKRLGTIHVVNEGSVKGLCRRHPRCVCWLTCGSRAAAAEDDLVHWFGEAAGPEPVSAEAHAASAYRLKLKYGMKPRAKR